MFDLYTIGRVLRISPEAPVPVMEVQRQESRPGGAGNVAMNLIALGASVTAIGRCGSDSDGEQLMHQLRDKQVDLSAFLIEPGYQTPVKNRLLSDGQQLIRIDREMIAPLTPALEAYLLQELERMIARVKVVAISDYNKGFLTPTLLRKTIELSRVHKIPVIIDPKGIDFMKYQGATVIKPNLKEAYLAAKLALTEPLDLVANTLLEATQVDYLLITRSEAGMSLFDRYRFCTEFPVRSREVKDVTGAGDTVLATIGAALANNLDIKSAARLANVAAGLAVERLGCAQITLSELAHRLLEVDCGSKIFEEAHALAFKQVLQGKSYTLFVLDQAKMTDALFRSLQRVTLQERRQSIIYVRGGAPEDAFVQMLSSLQEVHYIILHEESMRNLQNALPPHEIIQFNAITVF